MIMMYSLKYYIFIKVKIEVNNKAVHATLVRKTLLKYK